MGRLLHHRKNLIYSYAGPAPVVPLLPAGYQCHRIADTELDDYFSGPRDSRRRARYARYLEAGCVGFVITHDGEWAAVGWIAPQSTPTQPDHVPWPVRNRASWFFEDHTQSEHRGRGLHRYLVLRRLAHVSAARGANSVSALTDINPENRASRRSYLSVGFVPSGGYTAVTLLLPWLRRRPLGWSSYRPHPPID